MEAIIPSTVRRGDEFDADGVRMTSGMLCTCPSGPTISCSTIASSAHLLQPHPRAAQYITVDMVTSPRKTRAAPIFCLFNWNFMLFIKKNKNYLDFKDVDLDIKSMTTEPEPRQAEPMPIRGIQLTQQHLEKLAEVMPSSLTAPYDRVIPLYIPSTRTVLTEDQLSAAMALRYDNTFVKAVPRTEKQYADPAITNQVYCLHSFVPSKGAKADEHGFYGFMKCRGVYPSESEAAAAAENLIRDLDSIHSVQTGYVGRPFPVCIEGSKNANQKVNIDDWKSKTESTFETFKGEQNRDDRKELAKIEEREKRLVEETKEDYIPDPMERYIMLQQKRAHLSMTYVRAMDAIADYKKKILLARAEIREMELMSDGPKYRQEYMGKFTNALRAVGALERQGEYKDDGSYQNAEIVKYMCEDVDIGF